jgi:hypothetical protein
MSRPTTLPETSVEILTGRNEARNLAESLTVAYWLHERDNDTALFMLHAAHDDLHELAEAMGYTLTPKVAEASEAPRIVTSHNGYVWRAWDDRLGADASPYGQGTTEQEAVEDLLRQLEEQAA